MIKKSNITIENANIGFRNFSGKGGQFNPEGKRNFCVFIDSEMGAKLEADGWNVRWLEPKDGREERQAYLQVSVSYDNIPPKIVLISSKGKTLITNDTINILDWVEIAEDEETKEPLLDIIIRPYNWVLHEGTRNEKRGIKAYVKSMYLTIAEDKLEKKYYDVPDSAADSIGGCGNCETCDGSCQDGNRII